MFTHYEDTKGNAKCRNLVVLGGFVSPNVISNITIRYSAYDFLFDFNRNYTCMPSVQLHCWLGGRNGIHPIKLSGDVLAWLSVLSEVQIICI